MCYNVNTKTTKSKKMKYIKEYSKHLFTQLKVNLMMDNIDKINDSYSVSFKANYAIVDNFINNKEFSPTMYLGVIKPIYNEKKDIISFTGTKDDFSSLKDFKKELLNIIDDNDLSLIKKTKKGPVRAFMQDFVLKNEFKHFKLDDLYHKSASMAPLLKESIEISNNKVTTINAGKDLQFEINPEHFIVDLIKEMQNVDKIIFQEQIKKQKTKKSMRP